MTARRDHRARLLFFVAAVALLSTHRWRFPSQSGGFTPIAARAAASDLTLPQLGGGQWRLADHRGQVVLINYWATWCGPCREELPGLARVAAEFGPRGFTVVGVSLDEGKVDGKDVPARVQQFVTQYRVPYPVAFPAPAPRMLGPGDAIVPTSVLLDRHGRVVKRYIGAVEGADFAKDIAALLAES